MQVLYTAHATSTGGGRDEGRSTTDDGKIDVLLSLPAEMGGKGDGTNPEQLFAAGYSACFLGAMGFVAGQQKKGLPTGTQIADGQSPGVSHAARPSRTIRPSAREITRSHRSARFGSCVMTNRVAPVSACRLNRRSMIAAPVVPSRLPVGSSANSSGGRGARARAIATRCCSPPESCAG